MSTVDPGQFCHEFANAIELLKLRFVAIETWQSIAHSPQFDIFFKQHLSFSFSDLDILKSLYVGHDN